MHIPRQALSFQQRFRGRGPWDTVDPSRDTQVLPWPDATWSSSSHCTPLPSPAVAGPVPRAASQLWLCRHLLLHQPRCTCWERPALYTVHMQMLFQGQHNKAINTGAFLMPSRHGPLKLLSLGIWALTSAHDCLLVDGSS